MFSVVMTVKMHQECVQLSNPVRMEVSVLAVVNSTSAAAHLALLDNTVKHVS